MAGHRELKIPKQLLTLSAQTVLKAGPRQELLKHHEEWARVTQGQKKKRKSNYQNLTTTGNTDASHIDDGSI